MKISPNDIRQQAFEKTLRGYRTDSVDAFLGKLSDEWERLATDNKMLRMQLELAEKELSKLKEVEMTLFRTLKTAEDTSQQITDQANKAAHVYLTEAKQKSDDMLADARKRSALMVQDAENRSRFLKDTILNDLKSLQYDFKALEEYKENIGQQIRTIAGNAIDTVERFEKKFVKQNPTDKIKEATAQLTEELKQPPTSHSDEAELPALTEPEETANEPIPVDTLPAENPNTELPPLTKPEETANEPIPVDALPAQNPNTDAPENPNEPPQSQQQNEPKSGSFFDQF